MFDERKHPFLATLEVGQETDDSDHTPSCLLAEQEVDRWFAHRPRTGLPAPWKEALDLPPAVRLHRVVTALELQATEVLASLGTSLDSLVLTQPPNAAEVAQACVVFATAVGPIALAEPVAWDLQHRAIRASAETALRREDYRSADRYMRWLTQHREHACDPYEIAETANTLALFEVCRGDLSGAASLLKEAAAAMVEADDLRLAGKMRTNAAVVALLDGSYSQAESFAEAALLQFSQAEVEPILIEHAAEIFRLAGEDTIH